LILIFSLSTKFTPSQLVTVGKLNIIYFVAKPIPEEDGNVEDLAQESFDVLYVL
jgi:hypothetical protein